MKERFLPEVVGQIHAHGSIAGRLGHSQRPHDVLDLERQVVRAGTASIEESTQEVVVLDEIGLEHLDLHSVRILHLGRVKARRPTAADPRRWQVAAVGRPGVVLALDGNGDVVEVDGRDGGHARNLE